MPVDIVVCVKQVVDPETPASALNINPEKTRIVAAPGNPPVLNGFDENAIEAALRLKDAFGGTVTVLSVGGDFIQEIMKKPLAMGADRLVLVEDEVAADLDSHATAYALSEAIRWIGQPDLIICGRQASDWDNAQVPLCIAEMLDFASITVARELEISGDVLLARRAIPDGYEVLECSLPAVVTVSNELGEPRYPTLRGIMAAGRVNPTILSANDLNLEPSRLEGKVLLSDLYIPDRENQYEVVGGGDQADAGRLLALKLREEGLI